MTLPERELLGFLKTQRHEVFSLAGRVDSRRFLARKFSPKLPLILSLQSYPGYRRMVGENWMHWHDYYELWVATGGSGEYRCGNHRFSFGRGDVVLIDPLKIHGVLRMDREHAPLVLFFRPEAVCPAGDGVDLSFLSAWERRPENIPPRLESDAPAAGPVHGALLRLAQVWFGPEKDEERLPGLRFHLLELLFHLRRAFLARDGTSLDTLSLRAEREARLSRVLEYVGEHCHEPITQPAVATTAGMSTSRFRVFFKETTGWGFADYLRDLRLDRAARLLRESGESVAAVAYQTGFSDQSHLQRLFKRKHGISPLAYRRRHQASSSHAKQQREVLPSRRAA